MHRKLQHIKRNKKLILASSMVVALAALGTIVYISIANGWFGQSPSDMERDSNTTKDGSRSTNEVDYSGPSQEDNDSSQDAKKRNDATPPANTLNTVSVAVSFADVNNGNVEVRAFIPSVIEGTGTCTATLSQNEKVVKKSEQAFVDASSSQCKPIFIPVSNFPSSGSWNLVVTYDSPSSRGASENIKVDL